MISLLSITVLLALFNAVAGQCNVASRKLVSIKNINDCFNALPFDATEAQTASNLANEYLKSYCFYDTSLAPIGGDIGYGKYAMNIANELQNIYNNANSQKTPLLQFYQQIGVKIAELKDPHTSFSPPCVTSVFFVLPYLFYPELDSNGCHVYALNNDLAGIHDAHKDLHKTDPELDGKEITEIKLDGTGNFQAACLALEEYANNYEGISRNPAARIAQVSEQDFSLRNAGSFPTPLSETVPVYFKTKGSSDTPVLYNLPIYGFATAELTADTLNTKICPRQSSLQSNSDTKDDSNTTQTQTNKQKTSQKDKKLSKREIKKLQKETRKILFEIERKKMKELEMKLKPSLYFEPEIVTKERIRTKLEQIEKQKIINETGYENKNKNKNMQKLDNAGINKFFIHYDGSKQSEEVVGYYLPDQKIGILRITTFAPDDLDDFATAIYQVMNQFGGGEGGGGKIGFKFGGTEYVIGDKEQTELETEIKKQRRKKDVEQRKDGVKQINAGTEGFQADEPEVGALKADRIIVDVRGNGGGYVKAGRHALQFIFPQAIYPLYPREDLVKTEMTQQFVKLMMYAMSSDKEATQFSDYETLKPITDFYNQSTRSRTSSGQGNSLTVDLTDIFVMDEEYTNPYRSLQKKWAYENITLFDPQHTYLLTDGRCGSTCTHFAKHITQKHLARVVGIGTWPNRESPSPYPPEVLKFDVSSFGSGSVYQYDSFQALKTASSYKSIIDQSKIPAAFPRKGTGLSWSHIEAYGFTEPLKDILLEYLISEPDYWDNIYIHPNTDTDLNILSKTYTDFITAIDNELTGGKCYYWEVQPVARGGSCSTQEASIANVDLMGHPCVGGYYDQTQCVINNCSWGYYLKDSATGAKSCEVWPENAFIYPDQVTLPAWLIAVIVIAVILFLVLTCGGGACAFYCYYKRKMCFSGLDPSKKYLFII
ncbi:MAG: hypothetical protein EZS28_013680 [Streblomastix strix]|uniref:Uncharacterized protein n=1 Tax=Streblomastix strix TaxID=222440 RepID=A0A5J4W878_9EUKA|nr:MAG: hypothetical protein EZS28_013680 [Streblomastix strix]